MGFPSLVFPTHIRTLYGFLRFGLFIFVILPNPLGNRICFRAVFFRIVFWLLRGIPQCGQVNALSLTCNSHSGHFTNTFIFPPVLLNLPVIVSDTFQKVNKIVTGKLCIFFQYLFVEYVWEKQVKENPF